MQVLRFSRLLIFTRKRPSTSMCALFETRSTASSVYYTRPVWLGEMDVERTYIEVDEGLDPAGRVCRAGRQTIKLAPPKFRYT